MDMEKFERFTVDVGRRGVVRGIAGLLTGVAAAVPFLSDEAEAAKKGRKVNAKQKAKARKQRQRKRKQLQRRKSQQRVAKQSGNCLEHNPTCECLGFSGAASFKVDPPVDGSKTVNLADCTCEVTYDVSADNKFLSFTSTCPISGLMSSISIRRS